MKNKFLMISMLGLLSLATFASEYRDGTYRGNFFDRGEAQVNVEFKVKDNEVTEAKYRLLAYRGKNYLKDEALEVEKAKYEAALQSTVGKNVDEGLENLYYPENIEMAGASVRSNKIRSAMKDALNRGAYKLSK